MSFEPSFFSIERKVQVGFALALSSLVVIGMFAFISAKRLSEGDERVRHIELVIDALRLELSNVDQAKSTVRDYIITGNEGFCQSFEATRQQIDVGMAELRRLTADNRGQPQRLILLIRIVQERISWLAMDIERYRSQGFFGVQAVFASGEGKALHGKVVAMINEMVANEKSLLKTREEEVERIGILIRRIVIGGGALAFSSVALALFLIGRDFAGSRRAEAELNALNAELEDRVYTRTGELEQSHEVIRQREARIAGIVDSAMDAIISLDREQKIILFNPAAEKIFGCEAGEVMGQSMGRFIPERYREIHRQHIEGFRRTEFTSRMMHLNTGLTAVRADGVEFPMDASISKIEVGGELVCTVILRDITERKRIEYDLIERDAEIHKLNAELEHRVLDRTAELDAANKELEAFSYSISHDLRAPLRAVDGFSQAVLEDYGSELPEQGLVYLRTIREGAQRMAQLIDDLLKFARLSREPLLKQKINTTALVGEVLNQLKQEHAEHPIDWQIQELPDCWGDPALLRQVWINLLSNAFKYTRKREGALVEIGCQRTPENDIYYVKDNGIGFNMNYASKLFGVFQRLHRAEDFEGTGVGLAIVERIVHRHGGCIWAEAEENVGATFYFILNSGVPV